MSTACTRRAAAFCLAWGFAPWAAAAPHRAVAQPTLQGVVTQVLDGNTLAFTPAGLYEQPRRMVAVYSPKGGVGTTTIAEIGRASCRERV